MIPPQASGREPMDIGVCDHWSFTRRGKVNRCSYCGREWESEVAFDNIPKPSVPPPKPPEPQVRIIKERHIPPRDGRVLHQPWPRGVWLCVWIVCVLSFLAGVGFAEWTR